VVIRQLLEEFSEEVIRAFVQKNADYYLPKWELMAKNGSKTSWNWAAAFFGPGSYWLFYRKMVTYGFGVVGVGLLVSLLLLPLVRSGSEVLVMAGTLLSLVFIVALFVLLGLFGNYIYGSYAYRKLKELSTLAKDEEELKLLVASKGGTSVGWVFLALLVNFLVSSFVQVLTNL